MANLPLVELSIVDRSPPISAFAACWLAGYGVDALRQADTGRWSRTTTTGVAAERHAAS